MLIIWGTRLYGKTDKVPGLFHVATKFGHFWYIPLIPLGSIIVLEETSEGWQGLPMGIRLKSIFLGWMGAAAVIGTLVLAFKTLCVAYDGKSWLMAALLTLSPVAAWVTTLLPCFRRASYTRARELAGRMNLSNEILDPIRDKLR